MAEINEVSRLIAIAFVSGILASFAASTMAFAQAGSTAGTVGKRDKSESGDSSAARSSHAPKEPRPRRSAYGVPNKAKGASCGRIAGTWQWWTGGNTVFRTDGTAKNTNGLTATWTCSNGNYLVSWPTGIDNLRISSDGTRLDGSNNFGLHASGIRK
jgi:hypothetical protein